MLRPRCSFTSHESRRLVATPPNESPYVKAKSLPWRHGPFSLTTAPFAAAASSATKKRSTAYGRPRAPRHRAEGRAGQPPVGPFSSRRRTSVRPPHSSRSSGTPSAARGSFVDGRWFELAARTIDHIDHSALWLPSAPSFCERS